MIAILELSEKSDRQFSRAIRGYRLSREWTQEQMAEAAGVSPTTIANIEGERFSPSRLTKARIIKALPDLFDDPEPARAVSTK